MPQVYNGEVEEFMTDAEALAFFRANPQFAYQMRDLGMAPPPPPTQLQKPMLTYGAWSRYSDGTWKNNTTGATATPEQIPTLEQWSGYKPIESPATGALPAETASWQPGQPLKGAPIASSFATDPNALVASLLQPQTTIIDENNNTQTTPAHTFNEQGILMAPPQRDPGYNSDSGLPEYMPARPYVFKLANGNGGVLGRDGTVADTGMTFNEADNGSLRDPLTFTAMAVAAYYGAKGLGNLAGGAGALGGNTGAIAGSEAAANLVGSSGGDALGSLIASNAPTWGVNVAPEIAALGMGAGAGATLASEAGTDVLAGGARTDTLATPFTGANEADLAMELTPNASTESMLADLAASPANTIAAETAIESGGLGAGAAPAGAGAATSGAGTSGTAAGGSGALSTVGAGASVAGAAGALGSEVDGGTKDPMGVEDTEGSGTVSDEDLIAKRAADAAKIKEAFNAANTAANITDTVKNITGGDPADDYNPTPSPDDPSLGDPPDGADEGLVDYIKKLGKGALNALGFTNADGTINWGKALAAGGLLAGLYQGSKPATSSVKQELPEFYTKGSQEALALAKQYADKGFEPYTGEAVAPLSENEKLAIQKAKDSTGKWETTAKQGADLVAKGALPVSQDDIRGYVNPALAGIGTNQVASMYDEAGNLVRSGTQPIGAADVESYLSADARNLLRGNRVASMYDEAGNLLRSNARPIGNSDVQSYIAPALSDIVNTDRAGKMYDRAGNLIEAGAGPLSTSDIARYRNPDLAGITSPDRINATYDEAGNLLRSGAADLTGDDIRGLMNPYVDLAYAPAKRALEQDLAAKQAIARASAVSRGAFGTDRQTLQDSQLIEAGLTALGDLYGTSYKNAFDSATRLGAEGKGRKLTAGGAMADMGNSLAGLSASDWTNATNTAKSNLDRSITAGGALGSMAGQVGTLANNAYGQGINAAQTDRARGVTAANSMYGAAGALGNLNNTAWGQGLTAAGADRSRNLTGASTMYDAAGALGNLTNTAWGQGINASQADRDRMIKGGGALSDIATEGSALTDADIKRLGATGALDRSVRQAQNDFDYGQYQDRLKFPTTAIGNYATALRGAPGNTTTTTDAPPNFLGETLGALGAWNSWFNTPEKVG